MGYTNTGVATTQKMEERIENNNRVGEAERKKLEDDETVALLGPAPSARRGGKRKRKCCRMILLLFAFLAVALISTAAITATAFVIVINSNAVAKMGNETEYAHDCSSCSSCVHCPKCTWYYNTMCRLFITLSHKNIIIFSTWCFRCDMMGCAINANCRFCPKCKNCVSGGFCGKVCKIENLPEEINLYGQTC